MKPSAYQGEVRAFSLLELLLVLAVVLILAAVLLPGLAGSRRSPLLPCMSHLHQVGVGLTLFASDHNDHLPMQASVTNGGSLELVGTGSPTPHFQTISSYLLGDWGVLLCPTDKSRQLAAKGAALSDRNISYFLSMDATNGSALIILAGDRHLAVAGQPAKPGLLSLTTNAPVAWTSELHAYNGGTIGGNLLFADGHVESCGRKLPAIIQRQNLAANRLAFP